MAKRKYVRKAMLMPLTPNTVPSDVREADAPKQAHAHYFRDIAGYTQLDVYRILELFGVTCPAAQHIVKKALVAGQRGSKDASRDMRDIRDTAARWLEMRDEDAASMSVHK